MTVEVAKAKNNKVVKIPSKSQYSGIAAAHLELPQAYDIIIIDMTRLTMGTMTCHGMCHGTGSISLGIVVGHTGVAILHGGGAFGVLVRVAWDLGACVLGGALGGGCGWSIIFGMY